MTAAHLAERGFVVDAVGSVAAAREALAGADYDAMVLDMGLPDGSGASLISPSGPPALMLTARDQTEDRVMGLNAGADDYMVKPFDVNELHARLLAITRRSGDYVGNSVRCGALEFFIQTRVAYIGARPLALSMRETQLLELLLRRAGKVVPKRVAEDQLFGMDGDLGSNAVEVYVHRLRKRLDDAETGARIETVRGVGYMIVPTE